MIFYYVGGSDRSADIQEGTLSKQNQIQQRADSCSFEINQNAIPTQNQDLKIYDGDLISSIASNIITVQGLYELNVGKFYAGQILWVRIGQSNQEKVVVQSYDESTLQITLVTAPVVTVSLNDRIGELIFGGTTAQVQDQNQHSLSNITYTVTGIDYTKIFDKKLISDSWTGVDARYIINDICNTTVNYNVTMDSMSYASNGAIQAVWIETGDAGNPTIDASDYLEATNSGVFAWTFSGGTATWTATLSTQDLSDFVGVTTGTPTKGSMMVWAKASDVSKITSLKLKIGSSGANYITLTFTKPTVVGDWAYLKASFTSGVVTGTPNWASTSYAAIVIAQTGTASIKLNGLRVNDDSSTTLFNVQSSIVLDNYQVTQLKPTAVLQNLSQAFDYVYYIDYEHDLHFIANDTNTCPISLTDTSNNFVDLQIQTDVSNVGNRIIVNGGSMLSSSTYAQVIAGDGVLRAWLLKNQFENLVITLDNNTSTHAAAAGTTTTNIKIVAHGLNTGDHITNRTRSNTVRQIVKVDADNFTVEAIPSQTSTDTISYFSVAKTAGIEGLVDEAAFDYVYNSDQKSVRASSQTTTITSGTFIRFAYSEKLPVTIQYLDSASSNILKAIGGFGDGIIDLAPYTDANISDMTTALLVAQAKVGQFSNAVITGTFKTDKRGIKAGQLITITQTTKRNIDDTYVVQKVTSQQRGGKYQDYMMYTVTVGTTLFGWVEFMQKVLRNIKQVSVDVNTVVNTIVSHAETMGVVDVNTIAKDGGFKAVKNPETMGVVDTNVIYKNGNTWKWETSSGQTVATRWDLFNWA